MMIPAALLLSRFNPLHITTISLALGAIFTFLHGLSPTLAVLFVARVGFGFTHVIRWPARAILTQLWHPLREVPLANGTVVAMTGVAEFLVLLLTPILLNQTDNWRTVFHLYGLFGLGILLVWILFGRDRGTGEAENLLTSASRSVLATVLRYRPAWIIGVGAFGAAFGWAAFCTFWPSFMLQVNDVALTKTGWLFGITSLATVPPAVALGAYAPRIKNWRLIVVLAGLTMTGGLVGMLLTTQTWLLVLFTIGVGVGWGYMPIAISVPFEMPKADAKAIAVGSSFIMTLILTGTILGPVIVGGISDLTSSLFTALLVSAVFPIGVSLSGLLLRPRDSGRTAEA